MTGGRKLKRRMKAAAALLAGLLLALAGGPAGGAFFGGGIGEAGEAPDGQGPPALPLHAASAVLMDADTGRILYEKDGQTARPMASTTKILTCILALEQGNPEDLVTVSARAASMPDVQLNIREGEQYRLGDLLYSLMLESHNDTAVAVAEHIGGSQESFALMMNQKASDIGCENACFITPNGLDAEGEDGGIHSASAADLALIMRYCVCISPKREEFLAITRAPSRTIADASGKRSFSLTNHNALLTTLPEALSGKTGFTAGAGYCYVAAFGDGERTFTAALLGCGWPPHKTYKWEDMKTLSEYALNSYSIRDVFDRGIRLPRLPVSGGREETAALSLRLSEEEQTLPVLMADWEEAEFRCEYPPSLTAPVTPERAVGSVSCYVGGRQIAAWPIYPAKEIGRADLAWYLSLCLEAFAL